MLRKRIEKIPSKEKEMLFTILVEEKTNEECLIIIGGEGLESTG